MKHLIAFGFALASASFAYSHCGVCGTGAAAHAHDGASKPVENGMCDIGCCDLVAMYEGVSKALAADDLAAAKDATVELSHFVECTGDEKLGAEIAKVGNAASLPAAREAFKGLSLAVIERSGTGRDYFVMTCPMANADWIQTTKELANPYYGAEMLRCGSIKKTVTAKG